MFQTAQGIHVPDLEDIQEGYMKIQREDYWHIIVNVSAEHIDPLFQTLASLVREPAFLLLEHPTNRMEEETLRKADRDPFHKDIFYLDGLTYDSLLPIYEPYQELLTHDGVICYGFGSHNGMDEVYVGPYKIFSILTDAPEKYEQILFFEGFRPVPDLKTVWETFSPESPGKTGCIRKDGMTIYDMVEALKAKGLYMAERRPDR